MSFALSPHIAFDFDLSGDFVYERDGERERAVDRRVLYITVSAPEGRVTVETSAANELAARQFADTVHNAALHQDEQLKVRDAKLKGLHGYYADECASAAALEGARQALKAAEAHTAPMAAADSILAGLMAQATPEDLKRLERAGRMKTAGIVVLAIVLGLAVCAAALAIALPVYGTVLAPRGA